jgi:SAM-dependent methyltransferase
MREREAWLRAFHARNPGITSRVFGRGGTYERLAARTRGDILDLACGDRPIPGAIGIDMSLEELTGLQAVQGRAQELPFADASFDTVTCHLAFMLFDDLEQVTAEILRVLRPGGRFMAVLGGGPTGDGDDAFHAFSRLVPPGRAFGDRRASTEAGWCELFGREPTFERWPIDLSGSFDEVWSFLAASYQAVDVRDELRARFPGERVPLTVVTYFATVTR